MNNYAIRRAIVAALYSFNNPQTLATILTSKEIILALRSARPSNEEIRDVRTEWNFLAEKNYLLPIPGYDDYVRLNPEIRSKLDAADPLSAINPLAGDERLYGPEALR